MISRLLVMLCVKVFTSIALTWYVMIGTAVTLIAGLFVSVVARHKRRMTIDQKPNTGPRSEEIWGRPGRSRLSSERSSAREFFWCRSYDSSDGLAADGLRGLGIWRIADAFWSADVRGISGRPSGSGRRIRLSAGSLRAFLWIPVRLDADVGGQKRLDCDTRYGFLLYLWQISTLRWIT